MSARFTLDKANSKVMGVCSGLAIYANVDVTLARIAVVVLALATGGTAALVYVLAGVIAPNS